MRLGDTGNGRGLLFRRCYILSDGVSHKRFCSSPKIPEENLNRFTRATRPCHRIPRGRKARARKSSFARLRAGTAVLNSAGSPGTAVPGDYRKSVRRAERWGSVPAQCPICFETAVHPIRTRSDGPIAAPNLQRRSRWRSTARRQSEKRRSLCDKIVLRLYLRPVISCLAASSVGQYPAMGERVRNAREAADRTQSRQGGRPGCIGPAPGEAQNCAAGQPDFVRSGPYHACLIRDHVVSFSVVCCSSSRPGAPICR